MESIDGCGGVGCGMWAVGSRALYQERLSTTFQMRQLVFCLYHTNQHHYNDSTHHHFFIIPSNSLEDRIFQFMLKMRKQVHSYVIIAIALIMVTSQVTFRRNLTRRRQPDNDAFYANVNINESSKGRKEIEETTVKTIFIPIPKKKPVYSNHMKNTNVFTGKTERIRKDPNVRYR